MRCSLDAKVRGKELSLKFWSRCQLSLSPEAPTRSSATSLPSVCLSCRRNRASTPVPSATCEGINCHISNFPPTEVVVSRQLLVEDHSSEAAKRTSRKELAAEVGRSPGFATTVLWVRCTEPGRSAKDRRSLALNQDE